MKKIAICGGSFNPIHLGHIEFANNVSEYCDEVWMMPCKKHPLDKNLEDTRIRVTMVDDAVRYNGNPKVKISLFEVNRDLSGTYDVLKALSVWDSRDEYCWAIGSDCANEICKWKNYEQLINEFQFIVVPREGSEYTADWIKAPHILTNKPVKNISSTEIRSLLATDLNKAAKFLNPAILHYIKFHGFYGAKK